MPIAIFTAKGAKTAKVCMPVSPCSCRSRCSRFIEFKGSVRYNFHREMRENREKFMWSISPCSCRSRASRFKKFKRSVRGRFDTVQGREGRKETGVSAVIPRSRRSRCSRFRKFKLRVRWNVEAGLDVGESLGVSGAKKNLPDDQKGSACRSWCERGKNGGGGGNRTRVRKA